MCARWTTNTATSGMAESRKGMRMNHDATCEAPGPCNCAVRAELPEELLPIFKEPVADSTPYDSGKMWE